MADIMQYFQVDGFSVLHGSLRKSSPTDRAIWFELLCLCSISRIWGTICLNADTPYPMDLLAAYLCIPEDVLEAGIKHHTKEGRLHILDWGGIEIINWDNYQSGAYARKRRQRAKVKRPPVTNVTPPRDKRHKNGRPEEKRREKKRREKLNPPPTPKLAPQVQDIWNYYIEKLKKDPKKTKLTDKRKVHIRRRLEAGYPVSDIKHAIDNLAVSPYHRGENEQNKIYDDIDLVVRSDDKLEKMRDWSRAGSKESVTNPWGFGG